MLDKRALSCCRLGIHDSHSPSSSHRFYNVSQKSSSFLFLWLLGQMLTNFNDIRSHCSWENLQLPCVSFFSKFSQLCFCQILSELVYSWASYHKNIKGELFIETVFTYVVLLEDWHWAEHRAIHICLLNSYSLTSVYPDPFRDILNQETLNSLLKHHVSNDSILYWSSLHSVCPSYPYVANDHARAFSNQILVGV